MATYNYGIDRTGAPVYESSTPTGVPNPASALNVAPTLNTTINAAQLGTPVLKTPPSPPPSTAAVGLSAQTGTTADQQAKSYADSLVDPTELAKQQKTQDSTLQKLYGMITGNKGQTALTDQAYTQTVDPAHAALNDINNKILASRQAQNAEIQALRTGVGGNVTPAALAAKEGAINTKYALDQANMAVIQYAATNNYSAAKEIADRKVSMELEQQKQKLDGLTFFYNANKDDLDKKDQRRFEALISERTRLLNQAEETKKAVNDIGLQYLQEGGDQATAQKILAAPDEATALSLAGNRLGSLDRQLKQAQLTKLGLENAAAQSDLVSGNLTEAQIKAIDASPQGKKVQVLGNLKQKLDNYKTLVSTYGTNSFGNRKTELDASYADLKIAYKDAAGLGALQGPDITLLEQAIKPASFSNVFQEFGSNVVNNGTSGILSGLDQASSIIDQNAGSNVQQLFARNGRYRNSDYVQSLIDPLVTTVTDATQIQNAQPGQILKLSDGKIVQKQKDGSFKDL